jgi:hypothetical protein
MEEPVLESESCGKFFPIPSFTVIVMATFGFAGAADSESKNDKASIAESMRATVLIFIFSPQGPLRLDPSLSVNVRLRLGIREL